MFFSFSNFNIGEYFFGAFLCVEQMLENTFSSKMPFSFVNLTINFTKGLAQKYKGKCVNLVFCILCFKIERDCWFWSHRSICLLNAVLLIPIFRGVPTGGVWGVRHPPTFSKTPIQLEFSPIQGVQLEFLPHQCYMD